MLGLTRLKVIASILTVILGMVFAAPNVIPKSYHHYFPSWLATSTLNLGLDLRGGSYLLLEVDTESYIKDQMTFMRDAIRQSLRQNHIGYKDLRSTLTGVTFTLLKPEDFDVTKKAVHEIAQQIDVSESNGDHVSVQYSEAQVRDIFKQVMGQSIEIIRRRIDESGTKEPDIQRQGDNRILLQMPGIENPDQIKSLLGKTAKLSFHMVDASVTMDNLQKGQIPMDSQILPLEDDRTDRQGQKMAVKRESLLSGDMLTNASSTYSNGQAVVSFTFNQIGAKKFAEVTRQNIGKPFAIVLDNKIITAPVIQSAILGGSGIITGNFTLESAEELALLLRAGALPAPLHVIEERSVGPSLGNDSIDAGKMSAVVGVALVMVFAVTVYGLFGIFACLSLIVNLILLIACLSILQATLTLPGIAGIALSIGMAIDANVLIYERIKEELRKNSSVIASIDRGFKHAFATIVDANLTALLAAGLLIAIGNGAIKGFGVTLSVGLICSMFTAVLLTRIFILIWYKTCKPKQIVC